MLARRRRRGNATKLEGDPMEHTRLADEAVARSAGERGPNRLAGKGAAVRALLLPRNGDQVTAPRGVNRDVLASELFRFRQRGRIAVPLLAAAGDAPVASRRVLEEAP